MYQRKMSTMSIWYKIIQNLKKNNFHNDLYFLLLGYFTDTEGCETCSCKPEWMAPCGQNELNCDSKCDHGTYLDRNGCPSCECLPDPAAVSSMSCLEMQETNGQTECNINDGTFKAKQCNDQECRCVTKDGIPISDFKSSLNESQHMNCGIKTKIILKFYYKLKYIFS